VKPSSTPTVVIDAWSNCRTTNATATQKISNASHPRAADRLGDHPRRILDQSVHVEEA
jgi:hypothetical protein